MNQSLLQLTVSLVQIRSTCARLRLSDPLTLLVCTVQGNNQVTILVFKLQRKVEYTATSTRKAFALKDFSLKLRFFLVVCHRHSMDRPTVSSQGRNKHLFQFIHKDHPSFILQCMDGLDGNGTCICAEAFQGSRCQFCSDPGKYGPQCDKSEYSHTSSAQDHGIFLWTLVALWQEVTAR